MIKSKKSKSFILIIKKKKLLFSLTFIVVYLESTYRDINAESKLSEK